MPKYKEIVVLPRITVNGKDYYKDDVVRDNVVITEMEAKLNNKTPHLMGCKYVPIKEEDEERKKLFTEAKELGLKVPKNISTEKLKEKINELKSNKNDA